MPLDTCSTDIDMSTGHSIFASTSGHISSLYDLPCCPQAFDKGSLPSTRSWLTSSPVNRSAMSEVYVIKVNKKQLKKLPTYKCPMTFLLFEHAL